MTRHLNSVPGGDAGDNGDDRISAYLDGELTSSQVTAFDDELADDAELAAEMESIAATRNALRGLGEVVPRRDLTQLGPPESRTGSRRWYAGGAAAVVAVAAVWLVMALVVFSDGSSSIVPALDDLVGQHESAAALEPSEGFVAMERDEVEMAMEAPDDVGGMAMGGVYQNDEVVQVIYTDGAHTVSVFHQPGEVAWDDMPAGEMMEMAGNQGWHGTMHGADVVVLDSEDGVVTIVADGDMATGVAEALTT